MTVRATDRSAPTTEPSRRRPVLVVGGYGAVGTAAARSLVRSGTPVVVAGRDARAAERFARDLGPLARGVALDVDDTAAVQREIAGAAAVVMGVERNNRRVAELCVERGAAYVDVSATPAIVGAIEDLDLAARWHGSTAIVSVGLAPGVTNLLARAAYDAVPGAESIDVTIHLGLAGDAGPDSRRWVLDGLRRPPVSGSKVVDLPGVGHRRAHPFPFSDQVSLATRLGVPVTTRLSFEWRSVTAVAFALRRVRVPWLIDALGGRALLERSLGAVRVGSDRFVVAAAARHPGGERVTCSVAGRGECAVTGVIASAAVRQAMDGRVSPGVHHLDEIMTLGDLDELGLRVRRDEAEAEPVRPG